MLGWCGFFLQVLMEVLFFIYFRFDGCLADRVSHGFRLFSWLELQSNRRLADINFLANFSGVFCEDEDTGPFLLVIFRLAVDNMV